MESSPKDAAMTSEKMRKLYDNEIKKLYDQGYPENSSTAMLIAFNRSCGNSLKVMNGQEAVDLLTKRFVNLYFVSLGILD